jgi:hypothetical protein
MDIVANLINSCIIETMPTYFALGDLMDNSVLNKPSSGSPSPNYGVILPCSDEEFGEFISSLLGKPQTIEKVIGGTFAIDDQNIANVCHIVHQRISQQNEAKLIQFTVTIVYDDNSTHLINSLEDFLHYTEVKPLVSVAVHLSWSYLVRFHTKNALEKQTIEMSVLAGDSSLPQALIEDGILIRARQNWGLRSSVLLRISHTERTWGVDMESLLTGHVRGWMHKPDRVRAYISAKSDDIGLIFAILFFLCALGGVFFAGSQLVTHYAAVAKSFSTTLGVNVNDPARILSKIDFLTDVIVTGVWPRFIFNSVSFLCLALLAAILFGVFISGKAENHPRSFILLSAESKSHRTRTLETVQQRWRRFFYSIIVGTATGIVGNLLFARFFSTL